MNCNLRYRSLSLGAAMTLVAALGACATSTPYQPYRAESAGGIHGGYSEQQLGNNRFRVRFHGNELTSRERVETYLLYRAAELTLANGYDWFSIAERHTEHDVERYVRQYPSGNYGYWLPSWRYYRYGYGWDVWYPDGGRPFWADQVDMTTIESFEVEAEVTLEKAPVPASATALDARRILSELGPSIERPTARKPH